MVRRDASVSALPVDRDGMPWAETDSDKIYAVAASGYSGVRRPRHSELALFCGKGNADLCDDADRYERCADKKGLSGRGGCLEQRVSLSDSGVSDRLGQRHSAGT